MTPNGYVNYLKSATIIGKKHCPNHILIAKPSTKSLRSLFV